MPQIDFTQLFSESGKSIGSRAAKTGHAPKSAAGSPVDAAEPSKFHRARLGRFEWINISFIIMATLGGLLCAFHFFNGAELFRTAASWPREYLYPQPGLANETNIAAQFRLADSLGLPPPHGAGAQGQNSGDPFSRTGDLLSLRPPASHSERAIYNGGRPDGEFGGLPGPGSPLSSLGLPVPGGDALTQSFNRAVSDLQRATRQNSERKVVVVQTHVARVEKHETNRATTSVKGAPNSATGAGRQTTEQIGRTRQQTASSTANSAVDGTQRALSSARSGLSGAGVGLSGMRGGGPGGVGRSMGASVGGGGRGH